MLQDWLCVTGIDYTSQDLVVLQESTACYGFWLCVTGIDCSRIWLCYRHQLHVRGFACVLQECMRARPEKREVVRPNLKQSCQVV